MKQENITFKNKLTGENQSTSIPIDEAQKISFAQKKSKQTNESYCRQIIEDMPQNKEVMIELYRNLVFGNFASFNGIKGKQAKPELDKVYPSQGLLKDFDTKSQKFNGLGMVLFNIKKQQNNSPDYLELGNILIALIEAGYQPPEMDFH